MGDKVEIKIQDKKYAVKSSDDKERILEVAAYVDRKLREARGSQQGLSDDKTAILTALDIAGDYFQLIKEKEDLLAEINRRSKKLIQSLNMVAE